MTQTTKIIDIELLRKLGMSRKLAIQLRRSNRKLNKKAKSYSGDKGVDGTITPIIIWLFYGSKICRYCGITTDKTTGTIDHMQPLSKGGMHSVHNIALACKSCNQRKGNKTLIEFIIEEKYDSKCSSKKH